MMDAFACEVGVIYIYIHTHTRVGKVGYEDHKLNNAEKMYD